jgi:hypothetical protein
MIYITKNTAINFRHSEVENPEFLPPKNGTFKLSRGYTSTVAKSKRTECEIVTVEDNKIVEVISTGVSLCHPYDNFNKELGRKNSLTRALADLPRDVRREAWKAYFNR